VLLVGPRASDAASRPDGDALLVRLPLGLRTQQLLPADLVAELGWLPLPACKPPAVSCHTGLPACAGWPACWPSSLLGPLLRWPANAAARPERSRPAPPQRAHARLPPPLSASPSAGSRRACWPSASHALVRGRKRPGACSCKLHLPLRFWTD